MNIFDYAMQMEKDGENYYRDLAAKCQIDGLKRILILLADDEVGHYKVFKKLKENSPASLSETQVLSAAKNIFADMKGSAEFNLEGSVIDMYQKAVDVERKSAEFYTEKAEEVDNSQARELLLKIAEDEKRHQFLMEQMMEFLSKPQSWVEDAEFYRLDQY